MLQQSANIYESFFDNSLEGIIIFDDKGKIINANAMAGKLFGLKRNDLTQGTINEIIGEKYHPVLWEICTQALNW